MVFLSLAIKVIRIVFVLVITAFYSLSQNGCIDINALNYNNLATINDGSCLYSTYNLTCPVLGIVPSQVSESSGLILVGDRLWSHNDSGNSPKLFCFDTTTYTLIDTLIVGNATNVDWEDVAKSEESVFIGDFGNNNATRTDLKIYRIAMNDFLSNDTVDAETISFSYPDQLSFEPSSSHGFDCEAFYYFNDSLHLFSKHWGNGYTKHYVVPNEIGSHIAVFIDSLFVDGQITSADISNSGLVSLIGYSPPGYVPFMYLLWDYPSENVFNGNKRRLGMGNVFTMGQQEGITFLSDNTGVISSELITSPILIESRFFKFNLNPVFNPSLGIGDLENEELKNPYPIPFINQFMLQETGFYSYSILDAQGKVVLNGESKGPKLILTDDLIKGTYLLVIEKDKIISKFRIVKM